MPEASSQTPEITDADIDWVRDLMGLEILDPPRRTFLAARNTLDVSACPGSGKTTLIVAKLAILARKWPHRTKGICVLSHTNVAREEIQRRLGSTVIGQRLLDYPHFIDTIHGFVNRFLALPWLNSNGFPSPTIDNDVTTAYRRSVLANADYRTVQNFLEQKYSGFDRLRICARDLSFDLGGKSFPARPNAKSFKLAKQAIETAAQAGYFCYDEMFVWGMRSWRTSPPWLYGSGIGSHWSSSTRCRTLLRLRAPFCRRSFRVRCLMSLCNGSVIRTRRFSTILMPSRTRAIPFQIPIPPVASTFQAATVSDLKSRRWLRRLLSRLWATMGSAASAQKPSPVRQPPVTTQYSSFPATAP